MTKNFQWIDELGSVLGSISRGTRRFGWVVEKWVKEVRGFLGEWVGCAMLLDWNMI